MSNSNTNIGLSLTTAATGNVIPIQSNVTGGYIPTNALYTQVSVCTTANNNLSLPTNPVLGQTYTVRNDGATPVFLSAGSTTSTINGVSNANGTAGTCYIGGNGGTQSFIAVSNNGAANTAASTAAANNPLVVWHILTGIPQLPFIPIATATAAITLSSEDSGTTYIVPAMANTCAITLPANAAGSGCIWSFRMTGTVGFAMTFTATVATTIKGVYNLSGGTVIKNAATTAVITATAVAGDIFTISGDGTYWYVTGIGSAAASFS